MREKGLEGFEGLQDLGFEEQGLGLWDSEPRVTRLCRNAGGFRNLPWNPRKKNSHCLLAGYHRALRLQKIPTLGAQNLTHSDHGSSH